MVSTLDFESSDPSSNLGGTFPGFDRTIVCSIWNFFLIVQDFLWKENAVCKGAERSYRLAVDEKAVENFD